MDFYVIPPVKHLELMNLGKGNRFFCLAQLYKKHPHYREFFKQKVADGAWVTLDNGAGDHDMITMIDLFNITSDLRPSEVIPPDYIGHGIRTIRELEEFTSIVFNYGLGIQILGCPQGRNQNEWLFVYEYMLRHPHVSTIGLSKIAIPLAFLNEKDDRSIKEARNLCYDILKAKALILKDLHLLGMGDPREMLYYKKDPFIRSTDSCNTVWSAMNGKLWNTDWTPVKERHFERVPTPKDYFDREMGAIDIEYAKDNINWFNELLK